MNPMPTVGVGFTRVSPDGISTPQTPGHDQHEISIAVAIRPPDPRCLGPGAGALLVPIRGCWCVGLLEADVFQAELQFAAAAAAVGV